MNGYGEKLESGVATAPFRVSKGILHADADLYWELLEEFEAACAKLLATRRITLTLDLTAVNFISSSFVGCLGNLIVKASRLRKKIVLRVTCDISWLFDIMGVQKIMVLEVV